MKVTICSSSNDLISEEYKNKSYELIEFLASQDCDLLWGAASHSIMGMCYNEFKNKNKKIYGYTTSRYVSDLENLSYASNTICDDTFELKKMMFYETDLIVVLPGGTGTVSELLSYIEEIRSNNIDKRIIVYNIDGHYNKLLEFINELIVKNFNNNSFFDYFDVVNNIEDFKILFQEIEQEKINKLVK